MTCPICYKEKRTLNEKVAALQSKIESLQLENLSLQCLLIRIQKLIHNKSNEIGNIELMNAVCEIILSADSENDTTTNAAQEITNT